MMAYKEGLYRLLDVLWVGVADAHFGQEHLLSRSVLAHRKVHADYALIV